MLSHRVGPRGASTDPPAIHSMDVSSAAVWRCPNCKICEISGETPQDEFKLLSCEMCDRGFSLDLLDPPLPAAPPGLWICGQCVDCSKCQNKLEPNGPSLKHWSGDPHLCYRCGGCDGLVDQYKRARKCGVCSGIWRDEDTDLAKCVDCEAKIHARCDPKAYSHVKKGNEALDDDSEMKTSNYYCPTCAKKRGLERHTAEISRGHMYVEPWRAVRDGVILPGDNCSALELQENSWRKSTGRREISGVTSIAKWSWMLDGRTDRGCS